MKKEIEAIVTGRVQMVMYRDFTQRKARSLDIVGSTQNLIDGSVKIIAQGLKEDLIKYITLLNRGSVLARVDNINVTEQKKLGEHSQFNIIF